MAGRVSAVGGKPTPAEHHSGDAVARDAAAVTAIDGRIHEPGGTGRLSRARAEPPDGAVYLLDPTLRREFQTVGLRGATDTVAPLEWRVDDTPVGTTTPDGSLDWPLTPGQHTISARDPQGRSASASIVVK